MMTPQRISCGRMHRAQHKNVTRWLHDAMVIPVTPYKQFSAMEWFQVLATTVAMTVAFFFVWLAA